MSSISTEHFPDTAKVSKPVMIPIHNESNVDMYVAGRTIPAGETRHFEASLVPQALRPQMVEAPAPDKPRPRPSPRPKRRRGLIDPPPPPASIHKREHS